MAQYELNIRDYWRIIRKRRNVIIFITLMLTLLTFAISVIKKPTPVYEATASVKVDRAANIAGLFLEVITFSPGDTLATQTVMIRSFPVMERVAKALEMIPEDVTSGAIRSAPQYSRIISQLQARTRTAQEGSTNIINIITTSTGPADAQRLANTVAEEFRNYSILEKNRQVIEARRFIEKQLKLVEERLKEAEEALNEFRDKKGVISITEEQSSLLKRYSDLEVRRDRIEEEKKAIRAELNVVKEGNALPGETFKRFVTGGESPLVLRLGIKLSDLLLERENLLINYLPAHPRVRELDKQIENIAQEMRKELESRLEALDREKTIAEDGLKELKGRVSVLPETALEVARLERDVKVNEDLFSLLKSKYQEALIKESEKIEEVSIVRHALMPTAPETQPKTAANTAIGFLIGLVFGLVTAFVLESLDTSIGDIEDVEAYLNLPVLGVIPHVDFSSTKEELGKLFPELGDETYNIYATMVSHFLPKAIASESFRALRTNIQFLNKDKGVKSFVITSSSMGEGKTTVVLNLAITMAQMGRRVLIVDGDLRNHTIHHFFGLKREPGLTDAILGNVKWDDAARNITDIMLGDLRVEDLLATPGLDNVGVLTAGTELTNPSEFLNSSALDDIIKEMKKYYDLVIFDAPPVLPVADAVIIGSKVEGTLLVYQVGRIARSALKRSKLILDNVNANILGVILNGIKADVSPDFYHTSYYYYGKEKKGESAKRRKIFRFF